MDNNHNSDSERRKKITIIVLTVLLVLSIVAIVVLTFALFKSGKGDGKIGVNVTSGECKIDIVDREKHSLIGDVLDFVASDEKEKILFEPGATYYTEGFEIKNIGNIPIKFRVFISEDETNNRYEFQEAFDMWITKDISSLENAQKLTEFKGSLGAAETSETYYLVIHMKETAGNEFQNKTYTGIGITVYAVQGNAKLD